jgi:U32 family peptidase
MKPELLLPVSNVENFFAACEGGADAVYLGLKKFNARGKAVNFTPRQLQSLLKEAEARSVKVYLTLNTLIKNSELPELLDVLHMISQSKVAAVIIQDWGIYYLLQKFFNNIPVHASTQMANHNSLGAQFSAEKNFERVILARELTWEELAAIKKKTQIELELFVHGALCYSFSGMCLFSSFNGGMSANRGLCTQPCRRLYTSSEKGIRYFFSLKDLQLIDHIPKIIQLGISSLKIEGRMKSPEYVFQTASAYRMVLDDPERIDEAKEILNYDFGRQKTSYFIGKNVSDAITEDPFIGIPIGVIKEVVNDGIQFKTNHKLNRMNRLRILSSDGTNADAIKIKSMLINGIETDTAEPNSTVRIITDKIQPQTGDKVFLLSFLKRKFPQKFLREGKRLELKLPENRKQNILNRIGSKKSPKFQQIFVRIDQLKWMNKLQFDDLDKLILNLSRQEWERFDIRKNFIKRYQQKFIIQLPKFIPEDYINYYKDLVQYLVRSGFTQFMVSHVSQKLLLPQHKSISVYSSENIYTLNDSTIQFLKEENFNSWIYPFENDFQNLSAGKDRKGIVPLFFKPELFHSRMPVKTGVETQLDDSYGKYSKVIRDGQTIIIPDKPVAVLQHYNKLVKIGFHRFLLDLSYTNPSQNTFRRLFKNLYSSTKESNSVIFNFKEGLK